MWLNRAFLERKLAWHLRYVWSVVLGDGGFEVDFLVGVLKLSWILRWVLILVSAERTRGSRAFKALREVRSCCLAVRIAFLGTKM